MMFSSNTCCFVACFLSLSLSATATTVRGVHRELVVQETAVDLGTAENYAILTKAGISTVPTSKITGDIAVSPIAAGAITGFSLLADASTEFSTATQVVGNAFAANYGAPTPARLTTAVSDMETAYADAAGRPNADAARINFGAGLLGGAFGGANAKLTPGVYTFGTDVLIGAAIFFDAGGDADAVFIIQMTGDLVQAANVRVELWDGAKAENIFWQVAKTVSVGAGSHMEGILLVKTGVTFLTGSSLDGRILAQAACVLQSATIDSSSATISI
jgi:hypothetical protein